MFEAIGLDLTWHGPAARPVAPPRPPGAGPGPGPLARHGRAALRHPAGPDSEFRPGDVLDSYFRPVPAVPAVLLPDAPRAHGRPARRCRLRVRRNPVDSGPAGQVPGAGIPLIGSRHWRVEPGPGHLAAPAGAGRELGHDSGSGARRGDPTPPSRGA